MTGAGRPSGQWGWAPPLALALTLALVALRRLDPAAWLPACLFRALTGWPCPTCGGTRCLIALAALDWKRAFLLNPLVTLAAWAIPVAALLGIAEWVLRRPLLPPERLCRQARAPLLLAGLVAANWLYLLLRGSP